MRTRIASVALLLAASRLFGQCPTLSTVNPSSIQAGSPSTQVTFTGNFLQPGDQVLFVPPGALTAANLSAFINPPNQGSAIIPANVLTNSGTAQFVVSRSGCPQSARDITITALPCPSLSSSSPSTFQAINASVNLTLFGANLAAGNQFNITGPGGTSLLNGNVTGATQATVAVPPNIANVAGAYQITVTGNSGTSCGVSAPITIAITQPQQQCPTLSASAPSAFVAINSSVSLTLLGNSLTGGQFFIIGSSGRAQLTVTASSATQATVVVPPALANTPGAYQIVASAFSCGDSAPIAITITAQQQQCPALTSPAPSFTSTNANVVLTVSGTNLLPGDVITLTGSVGTIQLSTTVTGPTQATVVVPAAVANSNGSFDLTVSRPNNPCAASSPIILTVRPSQQSCPSLLVSSPAGLSANGLSATLTLTGVNLLPGDVVVWTNLTSQSLSTIIISPSQATVTVPGSLLQTQAFVQLTVTRPNSSCSGSTSIPLLVGPTQSPCPLASSISPSTAPAGSPGFALTVSGSNFLTGDVVLADGGALPIISQSPSQIVVQVPAARVGGATDISISVSRPGSQCPNTPPLTLVVLPLVTGLGYPTSPANRMGLDWVLQYRRQHAQVHPFREVTCTGDSPDCESSGSCDTPCTGDSPDCESGGSCDTPCNGDSPDCESGGSCDAPRCIDRCVECAPDPGRLNSSALQKIWLPSNFRLDISDDPCRQVSKIEPIQCRPGAPTAAVNTFNGNMFLTQPLISLPGQAFPLHFSVFYNSLSTDDRSLGTGWTHSFSIRLTLPSGGKVALTGADGAVYYYDPGSGTDGSYITPAGAPGKLTRNPDGTYRMITAAPIVYRFDNLGALTAIFDPKTGATQTVTSQSGNVTAVADSNGRALRFLYTGQKVSVVVDQDGNPWVRFQYNPSGQLAVVSMLNGSNWGFGYGGGALTQIVAPSGTTAAQFVYDLQRRVKISVDAQGRPTVITTAAIRVPARVTRPDGFETQHLYDTQGRLIQYTDPFGAPTRYSYDARNNIIGVISPLGQTSSFTYNADDRPLSFSFGSATSKMDYDLNGNPTQYTDPAGRKTNYFYDGSLNLFQITLPDSATRRFTYDAQGRLVAQIDPLGVTTNYQYDARSNLVQVATDASATVFNYEYDGLGRVVRRAVTDQSGLLTATTFEYIAPGSDLLRQIIIAPNDPAEVRISYQYDADGNLVRKTGPADGITAFAYDELNRPIRITEAAGRLEERSTSFLYLGAGNQIVVVDPLGSRTEFLYDAAGRLVRISAPPTSYTYDPGGRLVKRTDANGNATTFDYDGFNRLTRTGLADGSSFQYTYDIMGNRISTTDSRGVTNYSYDSRDRLVRQIGPDGATLQFGYDLNSNRISLTYPDGSAAVYAYDGLNRLVRATDSSGDATIYTYDGLSRLISASPPGGATVNYTYDGLSRVVRVANSSLPTIEYQYDARGRLVRKTSGGAADLYAYDSLDRLISWTPPSVDATTYSYDALSNRISVNAPAGAVNYSYDSLNRMIAAGDTTLTYDDAGNLIDDGSRQYAYDSLNRLASVGGLVIQYDGLGRRILQQTPSGTYQYLVDPLTGRVLGESGPEGDLTYFYGRNRVSLGTPQRKLLYFYDGQGNVVAVTDTSGAVVEQDAYDPFGVKLNPDLASDPNKYHFRGAATDPGTGLVYLRGRYYSPRWGRYMTRPY